MSGSTRSVRGLRPTALLVTVLIICLGLGISALVQPSSAITNAGSITALGVPLTENFDTLAQTGTNITWTDNSTIPGWYSTRTTYNSGTGSSNAGALYSFGVAGTNPVSDRALGSVASGGTGTVFHAARLTNNTGTTITSFAISYVGEQWRNGGNTNAQTLTFQYQVASGGVITGANTPTTGWTTFSGLNFTSPVTGATAATLDGNAPANRTALSATLPVTVNSGQEIWLRWQDPDDSGNDHGLAIDDFSVTAAGSVSTPTPTPTPSPTPTPTPTPTPAAAGTVVISQIYGGGGNSGATLKNDFIEIVNHSDTAVDLTGWSVQYASATLANWQVTPLTSFMLQPGQYYLIQEAAGAAGTVNLPTADATGTIAMGAASGKVALVSNTTVLTGGCPADPSIVDFIGYDGANCFEGSGAAPSLTNTTAALRGNGGCLDTNDNANDFVVGAPNPRNSSTAIHNCTILSGTGSANPSTVTPGDTTTLTVEVSPAPNPPSTGIAVVADLSSIGGSPTQSFGGSGSIFTFDATVSVGTTAGMKSLPVTITDVQSRSFLTNILLSVQPLTPANHITISQIYGGGGNSGATYTNDYVELYNPTAATVTITGWSLQYSSATGTTWTNKQPLGGIIEPGEYYLVSLGSGGANGTPLPVTPNISGDINISGTAGKIALVSNSDSLSGGCPLGTDPDIVDFVGYGIAANCHEGSGNAPAPSNTTAIFRKANGLTDNDQNGGDFTTGTPNPRRTAPIVELGPWVAGTDPLTDGTNVPFDATISIDFSEPADVADGWYDITCGSGQHNSATVASYNGAKGYHITPNVSFQFGEQCTVTIFKDFVHDQDLDDSGPNTDTLFANYVWTFTVVGAGQPAPYPPSVHLTMGNPSNATASLSDPDNYLMEKPTYSLSYNRDKGTPNWVSWHLDQSWFGNLARVDTFRADPRVSPDWYRVQATDYFSSGFDRGHMTPNADRDNENRIPINQETYLMSNMVPQSPDNNQGPWADFENYLRGQLPLNGGQEMYIVSGPYGVGGSGSNGGTTTNLANGHITVPAYTWKVVVVLPQGDNDVSRVTCSSRTIAILMPNVQGIRNDPWQNYLTTVDAIEALTGYDFFSNVPAAIQNCVEAGTDGTNPPGTANQSAGTAEDTSVTITLQAVRSNSNPLTFSIAGGGPTHGSLGSIAASSCTDGNCTATVNYTPAPDYIGSDSFNFKASDGSKASNQSTVSLNVSEVNDPPVSNNDSVNAIEDTTLNFAASDLTINDNAGPANESSQSLTVTSVTATASTHGSVTLSSGTVSYSPELNYNGPASFNYQVCDNGTTDGSPDSKCATGTVNVIVDSVNDPPVLSGVPTTASVIYNNALTFTASATDVDLPAQTLTFSLVGGPAGAAINPTTGVFTWTPTAAQAGADYTFSVAVTDGENAVASQITVTVNLQPLTALGPAQVWLGLKNSDDVGTKFDVLTEVFRNGSLIGSGQLNDVPGGSSGFNNAALRVIALAQSGAVGFRTGDQLSVRFSARIAASSGHSSGTARLWFNDTAANSRFNTTIGGVTNDYFVRDGSALNTTAGAGPKLSVDVTVSRNVGGNPFKPLGTWTIAY